MLFVMLFLIGTSGLYFSIFISTMAVKVFHADARGFGLLSSMMAIGMISGALLAVGRDKPSSLTLDCNCMIFTYSSSGLKLAILFNVPIG